jgi:hypothetical protein
MVSNTEPNVHLLYLFQEFAMLLQLVRVAMNAISIQVL